MSSLGLFHSLQKKYFDQSLSRGFISLYIGKTINLIAVGLLGMFLPIFLYNLFGGNFQKVIIYYGLGYLFYGFFVVLGARFLNRFGFKKALQVSVLFGALFYTLFYAINESNLTYLIPLSLLVLTLYRLFYWLPYHIDFAKFTNRKDRAREVSIMWVSRLGFGIFAPLLAGLIIVHFGFDVLFIIAVFLFLLSGLPYLRIPRTREKFSWSLKKTWQEFVSKKRERVILAYVADGAEGFIGLIVWPIFIFEVLKGNYFEVGVLSTLIIAVTIVIQLVLGRYLDLKAIQKKVLKWGSFFYATGWVIKVFVSTAFHVFITGTYHNLAYIFWRTPFDALTYEIAADEGHYVDEFTVLHEMALQLGRLIIIILIFLVSLFFSIRWIFILGAGAALILNSLKQEKRTVDNI